MHDVFVSYASPDKNVADAIVHHLESKSIRCFIAPRNILPGIEWRGQLNEAIKSSKLLLLVLSNHTNLSEPVKREIFTAADAGLNILQFRVEVVELNSELAFELRGRHWLDAIDPPLSARIQELGLAITNLLTTASQNSKNIGTSTENHTSVPPLPSSDSNSSLSGRANRPNLASRYAIYSFGCGTFGVPTTVLGINFSELSDQSPVYHLLIPTLLIIPFVLGGIYYGHLAVLHFRSITPSYRKPMGIMGLASAILWFIVWIWIVGDYITQGTHVYTG